MIVLALFLVPASGQAQAADNPDRETLRVPDTSHSIPGPAPAEDTSRVLQSGPPVPCDSALADIVAIGTDAVAMVTAPARFGATEWAVAGGAAALSLLSFGADYTVRDAAIEASSSTLDDITRVTNVYGSPGGAAVIAGGTWLTGLALDLPGVRRAGRHVFQAALYAGVITTAGKWLIGRERPDGSGSASVYVGPQTHDRFYSLPSGHATLAFAVSSSLAADIDHPIATVALYALATTTALGRVYDNRHWTSDILLGAMIGTACGWGVATLDDSTDDRSSWMVVPTGTGLALVWAW